MPRRNSTASTNRGGGSRTNSPRSSRTQHGPRRRSDLSDGGRRPLGNSSLYSTSHNYSNDGSSSSFDSYGERVNPMRRFSDATSTSVSQSASWGVGEASTLSRALYQSSPNLLQSATEESLVSGRHRSSLRSLSHRSAGEPSIHTPETTPVPLSATVTGSLADGDGTRAHTIRTTSSGGKLRRRRSSFMRRRHPQEEGESSNSGPTSTANTKAANDVLRRPIIAWREPYRVTALAAGTGGRIFAGGDLTGGIAVFDSRTGTREYLLGGHQGPVLALSSLPEMDALLSGSTDGTARLWSISTLQNALVMEGHKGFVSTVTLGKDGVGLILLTGGDDGTVRQWCPGTGVCLHVYRGHVGPVNAVCSLREGCEVASGGDDGTLRVWSIITHKRLAVMEAHPGSPLWSIAALEMDRLATAGGETAEAAAIRVWALLSQQRPQLLMEVRIPSMQSVRCLLNYRHYLFSAGERGELFMWDLLTGESKATLVFHTRTITGLTLENNKLCSSCQDHSIGRWSIQDLLESGELQPLVPYQPLGIAANTLDTAFGGNYFRGEMESNMETARTGENLTEEEQRHRVPDSDEAQQSILTSHIQRYLKSGNYHHIFSKASGDTVLQTVTHSEAAILHPTLPLDFIVGQLAHFQVDFRWLVNFVLFTLFLVCFTILFVVMYPTEQSFFLTAGLQSQLEHKPLPGLRLPRTFASVTSSQLFFSWLRESATSLWTDRATGTNYPTLAGGSIMLTALHVRVQRHDATSCEWNPAYLTAPAVNTSSGSPDGDAGDSARGGSNSSASRGSKEAFSPLVDAVGPGRQPCYADYKGKPSKKPFLCPMSSMCRGHLDTVSASCDYLPFPANCTAGFTYDPAVGVPVRATTRSYGRGGHGIGLFYMDNLSSVQRAIQALEDFGYVDDVSTRLVTTHVYMYNPNVDLFLAQHYVAEVPFSGAWFTSSSSACFEVFNQHTMSNRLGMHIFLFLLSIVWAVMEVLQNRHVTCNAWYTLVYFWGLLSLANNILFFILSGYYFNWVVKSKRLDVAAVVRLSTSNSTDASLPAQLVANRQRLDSIQSSYNTVKLLASVCAPLTYCRALFFLVSTDFFTIFRLTLTHMRFLIIVPVFIFSLLMLFVAESVRVDLGSVTFDFRTFSSAYSSLMTLFIGGSLTGASTDELFTNTHRTEVIIVIVYLLFVAQVVLTSQFFVIICESYRKMSRHMSRMPVALVLTQWLSVVRYCWQLTVAPKVHQYVRCGRASSSSSPHGAERRNGSRRTEAMIVRRLLLRLRALRRLRAEGVGKNTPPPPPDGPLADEPAVTTTAPTSPSTTADLKVAAAADKLPAANSSSTSVSPSTGVFDATTYNVFGHTEATGAEGAAFPLSPNVSHPDGPGTTTATATTASSAARKRPKPGLTPQNVESSTVMLRQVDLLSLLSSYYAGMGEEHKDAELQRWEEEEEEALQSGITTAARAIVSSLWERMAYTYHIEMLYSDATRDTAEAEELSRVTAALRSLADTMKLVGEVQASLEGHEAHLRPLVQSLDECLT